MWDWARIVEHRGGVLKEGISLFNVSIPRRTEALAQPPRRAKRHRP